MTKKKMNESARMSDILKTAQLNHQFLIRKLSSREGRSLAGLWVAVARNSMVSDSSRSKVLQKIREVQSERAKVLVVQVPKHRHLSLRF